MDLITVDQGMWLTRSSNVAVVEYLRIVSVYESCSWVGCCASQSGEIVAVEWTQPKFVSISSTLNLFKR